MKFEVNIQKKHMFLIVGAMILLAGAVAFGGSNPSVVGHSSGEVEIDFGGVTKTLQQAINDGDFTQGLVCPDGSVHLGDTCVQIPECTEAGKGLRYHDGAFFCENIATASPPVVTNPPCSAGQCLSDGQCYNDGAVLNVIPPGSGTNCDPLFLVFSCSNGDVVGRCSAG